MILYLKEVFIAEPLDKFVDLGALDGLSRGEGLDVGGAGGGGEEEHQLGGGGGQGAPVSLGHDVAKLSGEQLPLGQQKSPRIKMDLVTTYLISNSGLSICLTSC